MISVIIPALNEEENIGKCIDAITGEGKNIEIIVADGGSSDRTVRIARDYGVGIIRSQKGRGLQMNKGASRANGDVLLFLHADTIMEKGWSAELESVMADRSVAGGSFRFRIKSPEIRYRIIEKWVEFRCRIFSLPYGDQGIFVRREVFDELEGYSDIPLMEDVDIVGRMKKKGRITLLGRCAHTSHRRWIEKGWFYTGFLNQLVMLMYRLGVSPHRLARIYYKWK